MCQASKSLCLMKQTRCCRSVTCLPHAADLPHLGSLQFSSLTLILHEQHSTSTAHFIGHLQTDGFSSDSARMMKEVKKNKEEGKVQILLFSATFDEAVKKYANEVVGGQANQVCSCTMLHPCSCSELKHHCASHTLASFCSAQ